MEALDNWKLSERVTIFQAVMLIIGRDPKNMASRDIETSDWAELPHANVPEGYGAVKAGILTAVRGGLLDPTIEPLPDSQYTKTGGRIPDSIDIDQSYVNVAKVREYLQERNFHSEFFSSVQGISSADYLDPENPFYAPKLAAAVEAWTAVTGEGKFEGESTPKKLMEKWLRENAIRFFLNKTDGKLNEDAIAQITKIANWRPEGGASKSPGSRNPTTPKK